MRIKFRPRLAQLASQLHLTAEHFSRLLHELAREGLIRVQGREIIVPDPVLLRHVWERRSLDDS